ncbi:protein SUPPRESSOR OF GENE SILENCING 3 [Punica granatum]|uniref:Uncharacterized protein n=2 Tax=Punica granatum TaxID=22663 RepID=A0A2I0KXQ9_PUNGR|nr:protein SUPPRESSOR OF GENE SILENCING 3 [Punica granatum]PKI72616.1 hypothetical protein CRG98_006993 [Punica granatum]
MSNRRGNGNASSWGKAAADNTEQLSAAVSEMNLEQGNDDGEWEVYNKKSKNRGGTSASKPWQPQTQKVWGQSAGTGRAGSSGNAWSAQSNADFRRPGAVGRGSTRPDPQAYNSRGFEQNYNVHQPSIGAPLANGWNWQARAGNDQSTASEEGQDQAEQSVVGDGDANDEGDSETESVDDFDDDLMSDDYDSDSSQKSHETRRNKNWFKKFFESLDELAPDQISDPERQWHCPACRGGPGAIDWYRGLQPLMTHAKTIGANRVKLHREFAEILEEELRRRGASVIPPGELFGKWKGLSAEEKDYEIVWPPMVVIMNTRLEQDENDMWIGMGNAELLDYFSSYKPVKARHSYGPQGHRGMSVLIFEASASGYLNAEYLHKHFVEQRTDRKAWDSNQRVLYYQGSGGNRQLYGFMALKEDIDFLNRHSQGKSRLKFEMRSYQEMVVREARHLTEKNQQLNYYMDRAEREKRHSKFLEESFKVVSDKLRKTMEENRIVRQRTKIQHEQNKEEMDYQEQFFKEKIKFIHEEMDQKEENFEKQQQEKREMVMQSNASTLNAEEDKRRLADVEKFIKLQNKEMDEFMAERDKLIKEHDEKVKEMKRRHWEEEVELENEFNTELTALMNKYSPEDAPMGN